MRTRFTILSATVLTVSLISSNFSHANLIISVTDAGPGFTNWTLSGNGALDTIPMGYLGAESLIASNFGNFSFVGGAASIGGTGTWFIGDLPSQRTIWFGEASFDNLNDWLLVDFGRSVPTGTDLTTAHGTVVFAIDIASFSQGMYVGGGVSDNQTRLDPGTIIITTTAVPEPSSLDLILVLSCCSAYYFIRRKPKITKCRRVTGSLIR